MKLHDILKALESKGSNPLVLHCKSAADAGSSCPVWVSFYQCNSAVQFQVSVFSGPINSRGKCFSPLPGAGEQCWGGSELLEWKLPEDE